MKEINEILEQWKKEFKVPEIDIRLLTIAIHTELIKREQIGYNECYKKIIDMLSEKKV